MSKRYFIVGVCIFLMGCASKLKYYQYKDNIAPIFSALKVEDEIFALDDSSCNYLLMVKKDSIIIIDITKDSIIKKLKDLFN